LFARVPDGQQTQQPPEPPVKLQILPDPQSWSVSQLVQVWQRPFGSQYWPDPQLPDPHG